MLGIQLDLGQKDTSLVNEALSELIPNLTVGEKPIFVMAQRKIKNSEDLLDGMYMRCLEQALLFKGKKSNYERCTDLAAEISKKRLEFQFNAMKRLSLAGA